MILIIPLLCITNVLLIYFNLLELLNYLVLLEGLFILILSYKVSSVNIYIPFKQKSSIDNSNLKTIKIYLLILSLILLFSFPLYYFSILPSDTTLFILGALPVLFSGIIIDKIRKINKK